jgi:hypothetical protein
MAEGKRDTVTNAVLGIASLVAAALGILYLSGQSDRYNRDATDRAHHYARNAESEIARNCRVGVSADPAECINETVYAAREQQRGEMDLAAQWVTAFWTMVTGAAAVAGVILSAFGVFLVFRTFRAASDGNEIARQAMTAQNRAWMEIEIVSFGQLRLDDGEFRLGIRFRLKNIGKTVALNVEPEVAILKDPTIGERTIGQITGPFAAFCDRLKERPSGVMAQNVFPGRATPLQDWDTAVQASEVQLSHGDEKTDLYPISLAIGVHYHTIFDDPRSNGHQTIEIAQIRRLDDEGKASLTILGKAGFPAKIALVHTVENFGIVT